MSRDVMMTPDLRHALERAAARRSAPACTAHCARLQATLRAVRVELRALRTLLSTPKERSHDGDD
jgi:hypothetical protein